MDVIKEVAEARCLHALTPEKIECVNCQGQGLDSLRWPTLSRECPGGENCAELLSVCCGAGEAYDIENLCGSCLDWTGFESCPECLGSGRVPDVTLDKVLWILLKLGEVGFYRTTMNFACWIDVHDEPHMGAIPLEAACATLLGSIRLDKADIDMVD